jgi:HYR domain/Immunoglobulin domain/Immunoglobulin I-set domain
LNTSAASSRLSIEFTADQETVVLAWGGHIATQFDWGLDNSATSINGSPYHMRLISLDGSSGNQDRSLQTSPLIPPPPCRFAGPSVLCAQTLGAYSAIYGSTAPGVTYTWSLAENSSGATLVGPASGPIVEVDSGTGGSFSLRVTVSVGTVQSTCDQSVTILPAVTASPLADQQVCPGSDVIFTTTAAGTGPFTFAWTKDGVPLEGADGDSLTLTNVSETDTGVYCVEVTGLCGSDTQCATLSLEPAPVLVCPPDMTVSCLEEVPPPDPSQVTVSGGSGTVTVSHAGDAFATNGCQIRILRRYEATDECGQQAVCDQTILVHDTNPPVLICVSERSVEYGESWDFLPPDASDDCGAAGVSVTVLDTVTNALCGKTFAATRRWEAADACGNTARCEQTVTLIDTTPPSLVLPEDVVVECAGPDGSPAEFAVSASDLADEDGNLTVVCTPPSDSIFPPGTNTVVCRVTDACGNTAEGRFHVVVADRTAPDIECPASLVVSEDPPGSGGATVLYPPPRAMDICDTNPVVRCEPPAGSVFPVGETLVMCTAEDASGNAASCTFTVQVVPRTIVATSTADSGPGTLRQALLDANAAPGTNVIIFNFSGSSPYAIKLLTPLPAITDTVGIDGATQGGYPGEPIIELDGRGVPVLPGDPDHPGTAGLQILAGRVLVRGFVFSGFPIGILIEGSGGNVIQGNFLGPDASGLQSFGNGNTDAGLVIRSPNNLIGGLEPGQGNVISGNEGAGLILESAAATGNFVQGNLIGLGADGSSSLGNGSHGIYLGEGAAHNWIGGLEPGTGNRIAHNGGAGVALAPEAGQGNRILGNSIFENGGLGIDLDLDGVTPNRPPDNPTGPNLRQNYPVLSSARSVPGQTTVSGILAGNPSAAYYLEFFANGSADPTGYGEGLDLLGSSDILSDTNGTGAFSVEFPFFIAPGQFVTATATDAEGNTSEFSAAAEVRSPPIIVTQPMGTNVLPGASFTLCVEAIGTPPLEYQWRQNGANIPDATNACLIIANAQLTDGGSYTVVVANSEGAVLSDPAVVIVLVPQRQAGDNFADRVLLTGGTGLAGGSNLFATREVGEPLHVSKPGGKSVWYTWQAPAIGIATFRTTGSTFDTLLAAYTGDTLTNLTVAGDDEDRGGFFTSVARFNVLAGIYYHIAIDGFGGESGQFAFSWEFEPTTALLPYITQHPQNQTVAPGGNAIFTVTAVTTCQDGHHDCRHDKDHHEQHDDDQVFLTYQWLFNGDVIPGATNATLEIADVGPADTGLYSVVVTQVGQSLESFPAQLQINTTGPEVQPALAMDKFLDTETASAPIRLGGTTFSASSGPPPAPGFANSVAAATVVRGYTGTQVFSTKLSTTSTGDKPICDVVGGHSMWLKFVAEESGELFLSTEGSAIDTVLAVYKRSPTNDFVRDLVDCNNDVAPPDLKYSVVTVPVEAGETNFVLIDGVNGATGPVSIRYSLIIPSALTVLGTLPDGSVRLQVAGRPEMNCEIQVSSNLTQWQTLFTTNAPTGTFEFVDPSTANPKTRFYRAFMLP